MNQSSTIPFGNDATKCAGYAYSTERLGNVDLLVENTGLTTLTMMVAQFVSGNPSSYALIVPWFTVVPGGTTTKLMVVPTKQVAFFGSGSTTANISFAFRNPANLRGAQIDIVPIGRFGWTYDIAFNTASFLPDWPNLPTDGPEGVGG